MKFFILLLTSLFFICGCKRELSIEEKIAQANSSEVLFPKDIIFTSDFADTVQPLLNAYKILTYIDSTKCISCSMNMGWFGRFASAVDSATCGSVPVLVVIHPDRLRHAKEAVISSQYHYPVCFDLVDEFGHANRKLLSLGFSTFLLDSANKVLLVGDPVTNGKVRELYMKTLLKNEYRAEWADANQMKTISFGQFSWMKAKDIVVEINNPTDSLWQVDSLRTSCECTTATISKREIESKDNATVTITYKADAPGEFMREVYLDINGEEARLTLAIEGKAE